MEKALKRVEEAGGVRQVRSFYSTACDACQRGRARRPDRVEGDEEEAKAKIPEIRDALRRDLSSDIDEAYVIGFPAVSYDISAGSAEDLHAELYSLPLTIFLLLAVFGTIVAAGLPAMLGAAAVTSLGLLYPSSADGDSIFAMNTASMIGLGLGIDFSLLMVSRFREELAKGMTAHRATVRHGATAGKSIVFSA